MARDLGSDLMGMQNVFFAHTFLSVLNQLAAPSVNQPAGINARALQT
jgi:hypothetical protein